MFGFYKLKSVDEAIEKYCGPNGEVNRLKYEINEEFKKIRETLFVL